MKNQSLAAQFYHALVLIIVSSTAAALLTYAGALWLFTYSLDKNIYPEDYYEQQIPGLEEYIQKHQEDLLSDAGEDGLQSAIHGEGMLYQVVDAQGNLMYGTKKEKPFHTEEELQNQFLETTVLRQGYYIYTVPIMDDREELQGAVLLFYKIKMTFVNTRGRVAAGVIAAALFSPLIYIILFTLLFARSFVQSINHPLKLLTDASQKIKEKNLDFEIDYRSDNELGRLCSAFSEMKEELQNSLNVQWRMEQERTETIDALAHDLKSPLSIISVYTEALLKNYPDSDERMSRYLRVIQENAGKSSALVRQMQYTSDLEKSSIQILTEPVNLPEFLNRKVRNYELQSQQKEIKLVLNMENDLPVHIRTDADRLERILDNIISNSLEYTPLGGRIDVTVRAEDERIICKICDSGRGFSDKDLKKAMDQFYRGDEARQTKGGHSGLGLYIVKQLTEQLGGSVNIENSEKGGACVTFWFTANPLEN